MTLALRVEDIETEVCKRNFRMVSESEQPQPEGFQDSYIFTVGWLWAAIHCLSTTYWVAMSVHTSQSVDSSRSDRVPLRFLFMGDTFWSNQETLVSLGAFARALMNNRTAKEVPKWIDRLHLPLCQTILAGWPDQHETGVKTRLERRQLSEH